MARINEALTSVVKYFKRETAHSDDFLLSAIHYKVVFGAFLVSCTLSGLTSWYSPIDCLKPDSNNLQTSVINQWCYANATFIVKDPHDSTSYGIHNSYEKDVVYIKYYQWVTLALFVQAACFQIPRILWKSFEGGRIRRMADFVKNLEFVPADERIAKVNVLVNDFLQPIRRQNNHRYFNHFAMCQIFYLVNIVAQISFTDAFLGHRFLMLVPKYFYGVGELERVFPKQAKCWFRSYGPSGDIRKDDVLCVLALNVLIEKIYFILWCLLLVALIAAVIQCIYLVAIYVSSNLARTWTREHDFFEKLSCHPGDCLLLKFFRESVDCVTYLEFKRIAINKLESVV